MNKILKMQTLIKTEKEAKAFSTFSISCLQNCFNTN